MTSVFCDATSFNRDLSQWDVSSADTMNSMFASAISFKGGISKWDVSRVLSMRSMFNGATSFNVDVSKWDVSEVNCMDYMFRRATSFNQQLCQPAWVNSKASKVEMFSGSAREALRIVCTCLLYTSPSPRD